jgi:CubicO group peptidase (beta-lactamase class C family)
MRKILPAVFAAALCVMSASAAGHAALDRRVEGYLAPLVKSHEFNGVVLIARGDRVLVRKTYGKADFDLDVPLTAGSRFRIASVTKSFTGAAIAMLAERGKLAFTDPLSKFLPDFPNAEKIHIRQLLLHSSGVGNPTSSSCSDATLETIVAELAKKPLAFEPGTKSRYSNGGYALLARVVEVVSGKKWDAFLRDEIFRPLHLDATAIDEEFQVMPGRVRAFVPGPGADGAEHAQCSGAWAAVGSGALVSSAGDLHRWARAVRNDTLFQRKQLEYPYGWGVRDYFKRNVIEQSGEINGSTSYLAAYLDEDLYVVVLSNFPHGSLTDIGKGLAALVLDAEPPKLTPSPAAVPWTPEERTRWLGKFFSETQGYGVELTERGGQLYLRFGNSPDTVFIASTGRSKAFDRQNSAAMELSDDGNTLTMFGASFKRVP